MKRIKSILKISSVIIPISITRNIPVKYWPITVLLFALTGLMHGIFYVERSDVF